MQGDLAESVPEEKLEVLTGYVSMEQWVISQVKAGNEEVVLPLLTLLPEPLKIKFRELWKQAKENRDE